MPLFSFGPQREKRCQLFAYQIKDTDVLIWMFVDFAFPEIFIGTRIFESVLYFDSPLPGGQELKVTHVIFPFWLFSQFYKEGQTV